MTSKYQVSIPKALADRVGVGPGDDIEWRVTGRELRAVPARQSEKLSVEERLKLFDEATKRQAARQRKMQPAATRSRGWTREELYDRGRSR